METEDTKLPTPQTEGEGDNTVIPVHPVVLEDVRAPRELNEDRYRLKAPTFTGEDEVEQFIQEFHDVMEVTQWPPRVALLKLRMPLMDKAKPYGLGSDINSIFASLRARFGISARVRLQRWRHDPHTSLQEHAAMVMKLAQIAYRDLAICLKQTVKGILTMPLCSLSTTLDSIASFWRGESPRSRAPSPKEKHTSWQVTCTETAGLPARWIWIPPLLLPTQARDPRAS